MRKMSLVLFSEFHPVTYDMNFDIYTIIYLNFKYESNK